MEIYTIWFPKLTSTCIPHISLIMPHQMHSCELRNAARGSQSTAAIWGSLSMSGPIGLASSQLSKADIRLAVISTYYQGSASVLSKNTVATVKLKGRCWTRGREPSEDMMKKHWVMSTRENTVRKCPSAVLPLQINSLGCAEVKLITIPACVWLIVQYCEENQLSGYRFITKNQNSLTHLHINRLVHRTDAELWYKLRPGCWTRDLMKSKWRCGPQNAPARPCKHQSM